MLHLGPIRENTTRTSQSDERSPLSMTESLRLLLKNTNMDFLRLEAENSRLQDAHSDLSTQVQWLMEFYKQLLRNLQKKDEQAEEVYIS